MFNEVPSRRISQRRASLAGMIVSALLAVLYAQDVTVHARFEWRLVSYVLVFLGCLSGYRQSRHVDPWNPPVEEIPPPFITELKIADNS
jgi:disulfide bond formation protein DsbB